jgi:hypothetical protein
LGSQSSSFLSNRVQDESPHVPDSLEREQRGRAGSFSSPTSALFHSMLTLPGPPLPLAQAHGGTVGEAKKIKSVEGQVPMCSFSVGEGMVGSCPSAPLLRRGLTSPLPLIVDRLLLLKLLSQQFLRDRVGVACCVSLTLLFSDPIRPDSQPVLSTNQPHETSSSAPFTFLLRPL